MRVHFGYTRQDLEPVRTALQPAQHAQTKINQAIDDARKQDAMITLAAISSQAALAANANTTALLKLTDILERSAQERPIL